MSSSSKRVVEQLRAECSLTRLPLSQTIKEIIHYTEQHKENDPLIVGIDKKVNPFIEKNSCTII